MGVIVFLDALIQYVRVWHGKLHIEDS